jgi:hypothetical protein
MKSHRNQRNSPGTGAVKEVDLHLSPGHAGIYALERQLVRFTGELEGAIRRGEREIIFIHGSGKGRLREEIHRIIAAEYPLCTCSDASFSRYGYGGATTVTIGK